MNILIDQINKISKRGSIQQEYKLVNTPHSYAYSTSRSNATEISALNISLTTQENNSKIIYEAVINYESYHNGAFILERNDGSGYVELGKPESPGP